MLKLLVVKNKQIYKNRVVKGQENINMIINTNDIFKNYNNENIYLIQQYYIDKSEIREKEVDFSLLKNIENKNIKKIYLLNEKFYDKKILNNEKIEQININKRLEYIDFFNFINQNKIKNKGYYILSNIDIFFNESINKIKYGLLNKTKSIYCLTRYEYKTENKIEINNKYKNCSQDSWIIHSNFSKVKNKKMYEIKLGKPYCDNRICYLLNQEKFYIINDMKNIKSYHYHNSNIRNYHQIKDKINGEILHIKPHI